MLQKRFQTNQYNLQVKGYSLISPFLFIFMDVLYCNNEKKEKRYGVTYSVDH